jgi:hypothetical protein
MSLLTSIILTEEAIKEIYDIKKIQFPELDEKSFTYAMLATQSYFRHALANKANVIMLQKELIETLKNKAGRQNAEIESLNNLLLQLVDREEQDEESVNSLVA